MRNLVVPNCNWIEYPFQEISNVLWNQQNIIKVSKSQLEWQRISLRNDVLKNKIASCNKVHGFHKMFPSLYVCSFAIWLCSFFNPELESISLPLESGLGHDICLRQWDISKCEASRSCESSCTTLGFSLSCWDPFHHNMNKADIVFLETWKPCGEIAQPFHMANFPSWGHRYICMRPS